MKKLVIFGNGLGRAIDNEHFSLNNAMKTIWSDENALKRSEKELIATAIDGVEVDDGPTSEDELFETQLALFAIEMLKDATKQDQLSSWLTEQAQTYPEALARYQYRIAKHFFDYKITPEAPQYDSWREFSKCLKNFIWKSSPHIATLNYDSLLYAPFVDDVDGNKKKSICSKYDGRLIDGFGKNVFSDEKFNIFPTNKERLGYYLHLHGSPLFYSEGGAVKKHNRNKVDWNDTEPNDHIILCNAAFKPIMIERSMVLRAYWRKLSSILTEVDEVILFGYSGSDDHLNRLIEDKLGSDKRIRVVQRAESQADADKWKAIFSHRKDNLDVSEFDNILEFNSW